jgi:hypothetical protein
VAEQEEQPSTLGQKPGIGIDRTVIRDLLVLTPDQRLELMIASARNLSDFLTKTRRQTL